MTAETTYPRGQVVDLFFNPKYRQCAAGGLSETVDQFTIVGVVDETINRVVGDFNSGYHVMPLADGSRVFEANEQRPAALLVKRRIGREVWHVVPVDAYDEQGHVKHWYSAGGSYVSTNGINDIVGFYGALNLHDRKEW